MGYTTVDLDAIDPHPAHESDRRTLQHAVDLDHVGFSRYVAAPGKQIPQEYHYHDTQEELLYVIEGELHVETPDGEYVVGPDEVFIAEPDSPHRAYNPHDADGPVRLIAVGGPMIMDGHGYDPDDGTTHP